MYGFKWDSHRCAPVANYPIAEKGESVFRHSIMSISGFSNPDEDCLVHLRFFFLLFFASLSLKYFEIFGYHQ